MMLESKRRGRLRNLETLKHRLRDSKKRMKIRHLIAKDLAKARRNGAIIAGMTSRDHGVNREMVMVHSRIKEISSLKARIISDKTKKILKYIDFYHYF